MSMFTVLHFLDSLAVSAVKYSETYNEKLKEFLRKNYPGFLLTVSCFVKIYVTFRLIVSLLYVVLYAVLKI